MMCVHAKELIAASWLNEPLGAADTARLEEHLAICPECSTEAASLGSLWNRLADMPAPGPSPALDGRWQSTFAAVVSAQQPATRKAIRRESWFSNLWPRNPVWQAAIAMACLVAGVVVGTNMPRQTKEIAKLHEEIANTREM